MNTYELLGVVRGLPTQIPTQNNNGTSLPPQWFPPPHSTIPLPLGGRCFNDQVRTKVVETLPPHRAHIIAKLVHKIIKYLDSRSLV